MGHFFIGAHGKFESVGSLFCHSLHCFGGRQAVVSKIDLNGVKAEMFFIIREHCWFSDIRRIDRPFPVFKLKATGSVSYYSYCFCVIVSQQSPKSLSIWRSCSKARPPVVR